MAQGNRRFEFGWLEVLGLVFLFAAGSVAVFFAGIFVGKGLQENRLASEERVVRLSVEDLAPPPPARGDDELRLYEELARSAPAPTAASEPDVLLAVRPAASPGRPRPTEARRMAPTVAPQVDRPVVRPTAAPAAAPAATSSQTWSVQVNATKDRTTAAALVQRLRRQGFDAYEVRVKLRGETWYRVRVGRFSTMQEATAMVVRLKADQRYSRAFLVPE